MDFRKYLKTYNSIEPRAEWMKLNEQRLESYYKANFTARLVRNFSLQLVPQLAIFVLIIFISGFGLIKTSASTLPGDFLYPIKRLTESAKMSLTFSPSKKVVLRAEILDHRLNEARSLKSQSKQDPKNSATLLSQANSDFAGALKNLKNDLSDQIGQASVIDILSSDSDLPVADDKQIVVYTGNEEDVQKLLEETKQLLAEKKLEVALQKINILEKISQSQNTSSADTIEESPINSAEQNSSSTPDEAVTTSQPIRKSIQKDLSPSATGTVTTKMIKESETQGFAIGLRKED